MIMQQQALLQTEGVDLHFTDEAVREVARVAEEVNQQVDNIGARRLYTIIERIVEDISFNAPEKVYSVHFRQPSNLVVQGLGTEPSVSCSVHLSNNIDLICACL